MNDTGKYKTIRMLFELDRADNPRLYDDLAQFRQGPKRVNRLRTLAHEGVLTSYVQANLHAAPISRKAVTAMDDAEPEEITNRIFEEQIME